VAEEQVPEVFVSPAISVRRFPRRSSTFAVFATGASKPTRQELFSSQVTGCGASVNRYNVTTADGELVSRAEMILSLAETCAIGEVWDVRSGMS
jgi:hypothetical protein